MSSLPKKCKGGVLLVRQCLY